MRSVTIIDYSGKVKRMVYGKPSCIQTAAFAKITIQNNNVMNGYFVVGCEGEGVLDPVNQMSDATLHKYGKHSFVLLRNE